MKNLVITSIIALLVAAWSIARAQQHPDEYLGLPGDNLNLYAVMKLFQESETLEDFERNLNDKNSMINNLDLNGDNLVDYIMVFDYVDGDVHNIVLRTALGRNETQDVAVFTVQRFGDGSVQIQLVGDEALYGKNYIIEPIYTDAHETPNPGYIGNTVNKRNVTVVRTTTYEVAAWPVIRYIYLPTYVTWRSSWRWGYYPSYWNQWRPYYWHTYYGYHYNWHRHYYKHYRTWHRPRCHRYNDFYYSSIRSYSPRVSVNIKIGNYKNTYSRPDLRKKGEVLYARKNSGPNVRTNQSTSLGRTRTTGYTRARRPSARTSSGSERRTVSTTTRRTATSSISAHQGTDAYRKAAAVSNSRAVNRAAVRQNTGTRRSSSANITRKSTTTRPARAANSSTARQKTDVSRKSVTVTNNRTVPSRSVRQNTSTLRGSATSVSNRSVPKTQAAPKATATRSSSRQSGPAVSSGSSSTRSRTTAVKSRRTRSTSTRSTGRR